MLPLLCAPELGPFIPNRTIAKIRYILADRSSLVSGCHDWAINLTATHLNLTQSWGISA
ncbi:MAG TPA: hypothetical protein V6C64_07905 [Microcoleaceae cyanobacterium]